MTKYHLFLGSKSPRRKEFFNYLGIPFLQLNSSKEEKSSEQSPIKFAQDIANQKAVDLREAVLDISQSFKLNPFLVTTDTIVSLEERILGKPVDKKQAREYLMLLEDKTHQVYSAVCCLYGSKLENKIEFVDITNVTFGTYEMGLLEKYIETEDSLDKAGGYGAQGMAQLFIKNIEGSYSNVIGFPVNQFIGHLQKEFSSFKSMESLFINNKWVEECS